MIRAVFSIFGLILAIGLAGCVNLGSGTSPSRHYLIPSLADQGVDLPSRQPGGSRVAIMPIEAASYLDRPQLVLRQQGNRLKLAEYDRWAAPPADNLRRVLLENLELLTRRAEIARSAADYRLAIELQRLEGTAEGALLQLAWRLSKRETGEVVDRGRFRQVEPVGGTAPDRLVAGYGKAAETFSRQMAVRIDRLPGD